jgi:hypothetical protein
VVPFALGGKRTSFFSFIPAIGLIPTIGTFRAVLRLYLVPWRLSLRRHCPSEHSILSQRFSETDPALQVSNRSFLLGHRRGSLLEPFRHFASIKAIPNESSSAAIVLAFRDRSSCHRDAMRRP